MLMKLLSTVIVKKVATACLQVLVKRTDNKIDDEILKLVLES